MVSSAGLAMLNIIPGNNSSLLSDEDAFVDHVDSNSSILIFAMISLAFWAMGEREARN